MRDNSEQQQITAEKKPPFFSTGLLIRLGRVILPILKKMAPSVFLGSLVFILLFWIGLGDLIGNELAALTGPVRALLLVFVVCFIPSVSPLMGHGLLIAISASVLTAEQIAQREVKPIMALAALLAIDAQFGGSFIPSGLVLEENEPETISMGVPGIIFTRLVTVPLAVVLVSLFSF